MIWIIFGLCVFEKKQGFGSGSAWIRINLSCWIRIRIQIADPDPNPDSNCGSGSGRAKVTHKNREKSRIFVFLSTGCPLLRAEGFSCSLGVLYGSPGISKLQFLIRKIEIEFQAINFFHQTLDPDPDPESGSAIRKNAGSRFVSGSA